MQLQPAHYDTINLAEEALFPPRKPEMYANDALRAALGARARAKAEDIYSWDTIGEKLNAFYAALGTGGTEIDI